MLLSFNYIASGLLEQKDCPVGPPGMFKNKFLSNLQKYREY